MKTEEKRIHITGSINPHYEEILTKEAMEFIGRLERHFGEEDGNCCICGRSGRLKLIKGRTLVFGGNEAHPRGGLDSRAAPRDLEDRRVEITGPVDRKMVINALNSGAKVFMADFEDANSPTWKNCIEGQVNLRDAVRGTISFTNEQGKRYELKENPAVIMVRPRGWHLEEKHVLIGGRPVSASLFDFGLYFSITQKS